MNMHIRTQQKLAIALGIILITSQNAEGYSYITLIEPVSNRRGVLPQNIDNDQTPIQTVAIECPVSNFDFGIVKGGTTILCTFPIKNVSNNLVQLHGRMYSGNCRSGLVLPGQTVFLNIRLSTKQGSGRISKPVRVYTESVGIPDWLAELIRPRVRDWERLPRKQKLATIWLKAFVVTRLVT